MASPSADVFLPGAKSGGMGGKVFGLPIWAVAIGGGLVVFLAWRHFSSGSSSTGSAPATQNTGAATDSGSAGAGSGVDISSLLDQLNSLSANVSTIQTQLTALGSSSYYGGAGTGLNPGGVEIPATAPIGTSPITGPGPDVGGSTGTAAALSGAAAIVAAITAAGGNAPSVVVTKSGSVLVGPDAKGAAVGGAASTAVKPASYPGAYPGTVTQKKGTGGAIIDTLASGAIVEKAPGGNWYTVKAAPTAAKTKK